MLVWMIVGLVFLAGCVGGLVNALLAGELKLPRVDETARVYRPGWIGNVVIGGVAAVLFWGLYGRFAEVAVIGPQPAAVVSLTIAELLGALLTGVGGGRLLTSELDRRGLTNQNTELNEAKNILADAVAMLAQPKE